MEEKSQPDTRYATHVEQLRALGDRLDKQLEREEKILGRLHRLEERVDLILGSEPKVTEHSDRVPQRAY